MSKIVADAKAPLSASKYVSLAARCATPVMPAAEDVTVPLRARKSAARCATEVMGANRVSPIAAHVSPKEDERIPPAAGARHELPAKLMLSGSVGSKTQVSSLSADSTVGQINCFGYLEDEPGSDDRDEHDDEEDDDDNENGGDDERSCRNRKKTLRR